DRVDGAVVDVLRLPDARAGLVEHGRDRAADHLARLQHAVLADALEIAVGATAIEHVVDIAGIPAAQAGDGGPIGLVVVIGAHGSGCPFGWAASMACLR